MSMTAVLVVVGILVLCALLAAAGVFSGPARRRRVVVERRPRTVAREVVRERRVVD